MMDVDDLLTKTGEFGLYQIQLYLLISFPIIFSSYQTVSYIFTTGKPVFRCKVPECENGLQYVDFNETWIMQSVPFDAKGEPEHCFRYEPTFSPISFSELSHQNDCYPYTFNKENKIRCDSWIFKDNENTIVTEFDFICSGDIWKIALVGTINYLGICVGTPTSGILSDRYGRKKVLVVSSLIQSVVGVLRSFSPNYEIFLALQFVGAFMCGAYNAGFVLALEVVGPNKRVLGNAIICCFHSTGEAIVGLMMWLLKDWRLLTRYLFMPGLLSFVYIWIIPESTRWLVTKGKTEESLEIFKKMAKVNKKTLPPDLNKTFQPVVITLPNDIPINTIEKLKKVPSPNESKKCQEKTSSLVQITKSKKLMTRIAMCTFCWLGTTMIYYGSSLVSVTVDSSNKYFNFILTVLVELPGYILTWLLMDVVKVGRRPSLAASLFVTSFTCITFNYTTGIAWARLVLFLLGKFSITFAYAVIYIYSAEMFPTEVRNSLLGLCSMSGHIGSMLAPQTLLLKKFIEPMLVWGIIALIASAISVFFPETLNTKLPDTIEEAEKIGQEESVKENSRNSVDVY